MPGVLSDEQVTELVQSEIAKWGKRDGNTRQIDEDETDVERRVIAQGERQLIAHPV